MLWLLLGLAMADEIDTTKLGEIVMPLTPSEGHDSYTGVFEHEGAGNKKWTSDTQGFQCRPRGDLLEIVAERSSWPRDIPKKVTCEASDGKKVKSKITIEAKRHEPMFISDGTLVVPRGKGAAGYFVGEPPRADLIVGQGQTGSLSIRCEVEPGPKLKVTVDADAPDGEGMCSLKDKGGAVVRVPIKVVTAE